MSPAARRDSRVGVEAKFGGCGCGKKKKKKKKGRQKQQPEGEEGSAVSWTILSAEAQSLIIPQRKQQTKA